MDFSKVLFEIKDLTPINNSIWCPSESDKTYMTESAYNEALIEYHKKKSKLYFNNTYVKFDSCDCGGGYPCNHNDFPYEIEVRDGDETYIIELDGDDGLSFSNKKEEIYVSIYGLKNFTYADFIRICNMCKINLTSNYML